MASLCHLFSRNTIFASEIGQEHVKESLTYGVYFADESDKMMSIPPFLTAARTAFDEPISTPIWYYVLQIDIKYL
jgi:hypothetical protein